MTARRLFTASTMLLLVLCLHTAALAQEKIITGKISDSKDGTPIVGASVVPKGSTKGASSGSDGTFRITVGDGVSELTISSVGYASQDVNISGKTVVNVTLEPSNLNLNEVIVVGYGSVRKKDVTGSVQSVNSKDFNKGVIISPDQAIQGKAAGVMVISNSGQPGGPSTVRIRGTASIRSGQQPLYVVDGVPLSGTSARPSPPGNGFGTPPGTNPLNFLNPNDIGSIQILKDASAAAIYGSRGANGVILITTKRAQPGNPVIDVNATVGVSNMMKQLKVLDGNEYRSALQKYGLTGGDFGGDYDAMDAITRTGYTQNYNVAMGGGTDNSRYRLSLSYLDQKGIIKESEFKKYTAYLNSNFKLLNNRKLNVDFSLLVSGTREGLVPISNDAGFTGSLIGQALQWNPTHALIKPGTDSAWIDPAVGATTVNPLAMLNAYDAVTNENVILASVAPSYKITRDLEYKFQYSITRRVGKSLGEIKRWINIEGLQNKGAAAISNAEEISQQVANTLTYTKDLSSNLSLNAKVGHEYLKY